MLTIPIVRRGVLAFLVAAALLVSATAEAEREGRPNVVLIFACQHAGWAMSHAGTDELATPHLDRLAREGVSFENAYTAQPLCQPARASLMSGRMPHVIGMTRNGKVKRVEAAHPLGRVMAEAGYRTAWIGKSHLVPNLKAGFDTFNAVSHHDARVAKETSRFVEKQQAWQSDRPYFLVASFMRTHDACELARQLGGFPKRTKLPDGPLPDWPDSADLPGLPDNFPIPQYEPEVLRDLVWPASESAYPMTQAGSMTWRRFRWGYARLVEQMDRAIGRLLRTMREAGALKDTLVLYVGGHGDGSAAHRWNQKQVLYDESVRVPFIVRPPGGAEHPRYDETHLVAAMLDVMPTIADYAGVSGLNDLRGRSVRPMVNNPESEQVHDYVVSETTFGLWNRDFGVHGRMLRTERYKYIVYNKGDEREQLFDMDQNPGEMVDLTESESHRAVLQRHRRKLRRWIERTDDRMARPWVPVPGGDS